MPPVEVLRRVNGELVGSPDTITPGEEKNYQDFLPDEVEFRCESNNRYGLWSVSGDRTNLRVKRILAGVDIGEDLPPKPFGNSFSGFEGVMMEQVIDGVTTTLTAIHYAGDPSESPYSGDREAVDPRPPSDERSVNRPTPVSQRELTSVRR